MTKAVLFFTNTKQFVVNNFKTPARLGRQQLMSLITEATREG
jgi:hypothetical protein